MNDLSTKSHYMPPKVTQVGFKIECGFAGSPLAVPPPCEEYETVKNDGTSFWGGNSQNSSSAESYSEFSWDW